MIVRYILLNSLGWLAIQLSIAAIAVRIPLRLFAPDLRLYKVPASEARMYRNWVHIRRWKLLLPNGAQWVGRRQNTARIPLHNATQLRRFAVATRRNEAAHWLMLAVCPIFFLWNPRAVWPVLGLYAAAANLPCIAAQRYNRHVAERILKRNPA